MDEPPPQQCPMCQLVKPVVRSHLIPESVYGHLNDGLSSPVRVGDGVVIPTNRHLKAYLLCLECENILSKGGETWVCPRLGWANRSFPLYDLLRVAGGFYDDEKGEGIFYAGNNPAIDIEKLTHFALGIFWKAAVHSWKGGESAPMIELGPYEEPIRRWLKGEGVFPDDVTIDFVVSRPQRMQIALNQPVEIPKDNKLRLYMFHMVGAQFALTLEKILKWKQGRPAFIRIQPIRFFCLTT
jgi:hypothetical protein